jgi:hypothetical protein
MRILNILSGVAVLPATLAFGVLLHHFFIDASRGAIQSPALEAGLPIAVVVGILVGGLNHLQTSPPTGQNRYNAIHKSRSQQ